MNSPETQNTDNAHIIVFGNEKGGSGKSTSAMHAAIALLRLGYKVGSVDLDTRQGTLTRYLKNRFDYNARHDTVLPTPSHMPVEKSAADSMGAQKAEEKQFLDMALDELAASCDFIVIDTPGADSYLSRLAHGYAGTLVTPLNDSLVDLDLIAHIDADTNKIIRPSVYTNMVNEQKSARKKQGLPPVHWIVMRNRLSHLKTKNRALIDEMLDKLAVMYGFTHIHGFGERVIFKELFLKGLTLLDLKEDLGQTLNLSQIAARQEVRQLITAIGPEKIRGYARPPRAGTGK